MKPFRKCILIGILGLISLYTFAQEEIAGEVVDSVITEVKGTKKVQLPRKATIYSAVLPGLGQIYNHQWWKVPFIYGGFGAIGYMAYDFNQSYNNYLQAYYDMQDNNPATNAYQQFYEDIVVDEFNPPSGWKESFKSRIRTAERYRNLYLIGAAGFYLLNILDANVNAHFLDFDISEDLSLNLSPVSIDPLACRPVPGMTLVFNF